MLLSDVKSFFSFFNLSSIRKWVSVEYLFINYFWFYSICAVSFHVIHTESLFNVGFPIILFAMLAKTHYVDKLNIIDFLWIADFIWILITWIMNDYPNKMYLIFRSFTQELGYMLSYWIARGNRINYIEKIIENAQKPLFIGCVVGIYCFFWEPAWYKAATDECIYTFYGVGNFSKESMLEQYRLRSFYKGPYVLAYFCAMALIYEFFLLFIYKRKIIKYNYHIFFIFILISTGILCMMRAPLFCIFAGFIAALFYSKKYIKGGAVSLKIVYWLMGIMALFFLGHSYIDIPILDFMNSKVESFSDNKENFILERLFLQAKSFTLTGEGYARYNVIALYKFGMPSIADGEYMKIITEQGFVGFTIMITMFVIGIYKSLKKYKVLYFEFCLLAMLFVCMVGADPLSISDKHCFIFWLALGQVSRYKNTSYLK